MIFLSEEKKIITNYIIFYLEQLNQLIVIHIERIKFIIQNIQNLSNK